MELSVEKIKVILIGEAADTIPILTSPVTNDPAIEVYRLLSDLSNVLDHGHPDFVVDGTRFKVELPSLSSEYIFVALPLAYSQDQRCYILYVYTIRIAEDYFVESFQIESILRQIDESSPVYEILQNSSFSINVYRNSHLSSIPGEFRSGAILYVTLDNNGEVEVEERGEDTLYRNVTHVHTGRKVTELRRFTGSQLVHVLTTKNLLATDTEDDVDVVDEGIHRHPWTQEVSHAQEQVVTVATPTPIQDGMLVVPNGGVEVMKPKVDTLVHALEHVFNGSCGNCQLSNESPLIAKCLHMRDCYEQNQFISEEQILEFKDLIRVHDRCCHDNQCKIPHLYAGCKNPALPPEESNHSSFHCSSTESSIHSSEHSSSFHSSLHSSLRSSLHSSLHSAHQIGPLPGSLYSLQEHRPPSKTTLSPNNNTPSYPYYHSPIKESTNYSPLPPFHNTSSSNSYRNLSSFPLTTDLRKKRHGDILYDSGDVFRDFPSGNFSSLPYYQDLPSCTRLGKGGNGTVIQFPIGQRMFALKYTKYRKAENEIWSTFYHENVTMLLGLVVVKESDEEWSCCQIMSCMTGSLKSELSNIGGSLVNYLITEPASETLIHSNLQYILKCILSGLSYLSSREVEIQDLKSSNVLVYKTCSCPAVFTCQCIGSTHRYSIQISDYDSVRAADTKLHVAAAQYQDSTQQITRKCPQECCRELGTLGNRAPEHFVNTAVPVCGPWSDIWGFGALVLDLFFHESEKKESIKDANILAGKPNCCTLSRGENQSELILPLMRLKKLQVFRYRLTALVAELAEKCLKPDINQRPSATDLLNLLFFLPTN